MARYVSKLQKRGPDGSFRMELDPIRSEYPINAGSGFVALASTVSANLVLSVPSGKVFLWKYLYAYGGTVGTIVFYDGGSVASLNTTIYEVYVASAQSSPGGNEFKPMGLYVYSLLFASIGAVSTPTIKVGGLLFAISAVD